MLKLKHSTRPAARRRGFLAVEAIAAIGLTVALAGLLTLAVANYGATRRETDTRRLLRLTAATELTRMQAGLTPLENAAAQERPDGTRLTITTTPGSGTWSGLMRVRVVASKVVSGTRRIEVEVSGYVPAAEAPR